jgi:dienelactone hydrolase
MFSASDSGSITPSQISMERRNSDMFTHQTVPDLNSVQAHIPCGRATLEGELTIPPGARGVVLFAHGSGSSRHSPRNQFVARVIRESGQGTLLFDLLTEEEEIEDNITRRLRFDIALLANRLVQATRWLTEQEMTRDLGLGYFGSSTGAGAALVAAAAMNDQPINAVVSRGGRPDLAGEALPWVKAPTLLIVGGFDHVVIELNEAALSQLRCEKALRIVPEATHLFEEPGTLEAAARTAADWFDQHLQRHPHRERPGN